MEEDRPASPPPLLAYTTSGLQNGKGGKKGTRGTQARKSVPTPARRMRRSNEPVLFDETARRDFLTGFRKRKQARIENGRKKAEEREKEERRQARAESRKARKEQAAENVRMEKIAYGDGEEEGGQGGEGEAEETRGFSPSAYETEEHHTTVTVQEWDPDAEEGEDAMPTHVIREDEEELQVAQQPAKSVSSSAKKAQALNISLPPSSRRMAKKLKNAADASSASKKRRSDARDLSKLLDVSDELVIPTVPTSHFGGGGTSAGAADGETTPAGPKKKPKFHYESKLERAKAKAKIREDRTKYNERRREERLHAAKSGGGGGGGGGKGKRGSGARRKK